MSKPNIMSQSLQFTSKATNPKIQSKFSIGETLSSDSHNPELYFSNQYNKQDLNDQLKVDLRANTKSKQNQQILVNKEYNQTALFSDQFQNIQQCSIFDQKHFMIMEREYKMKNAQISNLRLQNESLRDSNNTIRLMLEKSQHANIKIEEQLSQKISQLHVAQSKINRFQDIIQSLQRNQKFSTISLKKQLQYQEAKTTSIMKQIIKGRLQLQKVSQQKIYAERQTQMKNKQIEELSKMVDSLNNTISELNKSIQIFGQKQKQYLQQVNNLNQKIQDLNIQFIQYKDEITKSMVQQLDRSRSSSILKASISQEETFQTVQKLEEKVFFLQNQIKTFNERVESLIKENVSLNIQIGKMEFSKRMFAQRSLKGFWSPRVQSNLLRGNAYVTSQQQRLSKTISNNHYQTQIYKEKCQRLQVTLQNIRNDYNSRQQSILKLQEQIEQIKLTEQIKVNSICQKQQVQVSNLMTDLQIKTVKIAQLQASNLKKSQQIKQISQLLGKVSQRKKTNLNSKH